MAVSLPAPTLGIEQNTVIYVLLPPDGRFVVRQAAGGCGVIVNEDDPLYQVVLWSAVIDEVDPKTGLTGSLSEEQLFVIAQAHRLAVGVHPVVNDLRARLVRGRARTLPDVL